MKTCFVCHMSAAYEQDEILHLGWCPAYTKPAPAPPPTSCQCGSPDAHWQFCPKFVRYEDRS